MVVTTDLAARGIDIAQLPAVVNYDLPRSAVDYVHRIGRTGRAGESGVAVSFVSAGTQTHWQLIESARAGKIPAADSRLRAHGNRARSRRAGHRRRQKRPSKKDKLRAAGFAPAARSILR